MSSGAMITEVCRAFGVSETTFHRWRNQYGGMKAEEAKRLRELEKENARLKRIVADQALDKPDPQRSRAGKLLSPARRRIAVRHVRWCFRISERRRAAGGGTAWHRGVARLNLVEANAKRLGIDPEQLERPISKPSRQQRNAGRRR
jgi:Transposase